MNSAFFTGRLAKEAVFRDGGSTPVCYFTLIRNEYAGKDNQGAARERRVSIDFTAFGSDAHAIAEHVCVGDQMVVSYRVANNNRDLGNGHTEYGYSFIIESFEFGAPGAIKREKLAALSNRG